MHDVGWCTYWCPQLLHACRLRGIPGHMHMCKPYPKTRCSQLSRSWLQGPAPATRSAAHGS